MKLGESLLTARKKAVLLQSCPICSSLGDDSLVPIAEMARERVLEKDEILALQGDPCTGFYLVLSGKLRVYKTSSSGKEKVFAIAERGMTFAEDALFGAGKFLENAMALEKTKVLYVPREEFLAVLRTRPELAFQVMESLCAWIKRLASTVEIGAFLGASAKVVHYLVELASQQGATGRSLVLPDKKKAVADRLGITPETLSRALHDLEERNLISMKGREITVLDLDTLKEVAEL